MSPLLHVQLSDLSAVVASSLFSAIWEGSVLAAAVALSLRALPRLSAAARSAIWLNVFVLLALLHLLPLFAPGSSAAPATSAAAIHLDLRWSMGVAAAWALLSIWRAAQLAHGAVALRRIARRATPVVPDPVVADLLEGREFGGRRAELCTSTDVERPGVYGFFRPRILVPPGLLERLSAPELRQVILHETEHLRRADDWTNLLQKLALVLFPLNPALFWVERRLCAERELACDDRVLRASPGRKSYALCLTRLAEYSMLNRGISLVLGAFGRRPELVRRVHRILASPARAMSGRAAVFTSASLISAALAAAIALARSPQLVTFAPTFEAQNLPAISARELMHEEFGGEPKLVKAVVEPAPQLSQTPTRVRAAADRPRKSLSHNARPAFTVRTQRPETTVITRPDMEFARQDLPPADLVPVAHEFVVLTEWSSTDAPPRVVIAVARESRPRYAAVPFANGWLIVQI